MLIFKFYTEAMGYRLSYSFKKNLTHFEYKSYFIFLSNSYKFA